MKRLLPLLLLAILAACGDKPPRTTEIQVEADVVQPGTMCRAGKDGGPLLADRGIGGTGASFRDRLVDRGIGGTGIVGVVTGFASVCVNGLEVRYDGNVPVDVDGTPSRPDQLRVGQIVAIRAANPAAGTSLPSWAWGISVRTELAGPIEAVEVGRNAMTIAGQRVIVRPSTWGANRFGLGDWTSVSGLRQSDGTIIASRLDDAPSGKLFVRGQISRHDGMVWIGGLRLAGAPAASLRAGDYVSAAGAYQSGVGQMVAVAPDVLAANPTGYFGSAVNQLVVQAFVTVDRDAVWLNDGLKVPAGPFVRQPKPIAGDAIVTLERQADGAFLATALRYTRYPSSADEMGALAHAWHVSTVVPLPIPPAPPATVPSAEASRPNGNAPSTASSPMTDDAAHTVPDASAGSSADGAPLPPISCAECGRLDKHRGSNPVAIAVRRTPRLLVSVRPDALGKELPATIAVFSTATLPAPAGKNAPSSHGH